MRVTSTVIQFVVSVETIFKSEGLQNYGSSARSPLVRFWSELRCLSPLSSVRLSHCSLRPLLIPLLAPLTGKPASGWWLHTFDVGATGAITPSPFTHINTVRSPKRASIILTPPQTFILFRKALPFICAQGYKLLTAWILKS
jgi:hypothetical protein